MRRAIGIVLVGVVVVAGYLLLDPYLRDVVSYRLQPTAARALDLGQRHFDSRRADLYDIDAASRYLQEAYALDPTYRAVNHEMARIAFLRGDFEEALRYIDTEVELHGDDLPNAYYIRGLIRGYMGDYENAARDYEHYLVTDPRNWAAVNDYAWVLLKAERPVAARAAILPLLWDVPDNPWLLNTVAIASYEMGEREEAREHIMRAAENVRSLDTTAWLRAYPGNDPLIAEEGISSLRAAIEDNMHSITSTTSPDALQLNL